LGTWTSYDIQAADKNENQGLKIVTPLLKDGSTNVNVSMYLEFRRVSRWWDLKQNTVVPKGGDLSFISTATGVILHFYPNPNAGSYNQWGDYWTTYEGALKLVSQTYISDANRTGLHFRVRANNTNDNSSDIAQIEICRCVVGQDMNTCCTSSSSATPTAAPTTSAPTTKAPTTAAPTTKAPTTGAPTTKAPTTAAPTTAAPTTKAPTTAAPTTKGPTFTPTTAGPTKAPTTGVPTTAVPTKTPTTGAPTLPTAAPTSAPTKKKDATVAGMSTTTIGAIGGGAVLVIGGAAAVIIVKKKRGTLRMGFGTNNQRQVAAIHI
jgi:hypothetical protein